MHNALYFFAKRIGINTLEQIQLRILLPSQNDISPAQKILGCYIFKLYKNQNSSTKQAYGVLSSFQPNSFMAVFNDSLTNPEDIRLGVKSTVEDSCLVSAGKYC